MASKPQNIYGYDRSQVQKVLQTCLYLATKLGDLLDEIVLVGGLVPYLLVDQEDLPMGLESHSGTMDLDLGFALAMLDQERYRELASTFAGCRILAGRYQGGELSDFNPGGWLHGRVCDC